MTLHHRTTAVALATVLLGLTVALSGPVAAEEWVAQSDELCTYCGSYKDADLAAGAVTTAYTPGIGYGAGVSEHTARGIVLSTSEARHSEPCAGQYACDDERSRMIGAALDASTEGLNRQSADATLASPAR
jgi:hypothetical protein